MLPEIARTAILRRVGQRPQARAMRNELQREALLFAHAISMSVRFQAANIDGARTLPTR